MAETNPNYSQVIRRWFSIAFAIFALTVLSGGYFVLEVLPKTYTATAEIQVRPDGPVASTGVDTKEDPNAVMTFFQAEFEIIQSPDVLLPIIRDLNLDQIWARRMHKANGEKLQPLEALAYMHKILKIDLMRGTNIVKITAISEVPTEAADIANAIADRYKIMRDVQEDQRQGRGSVSLRDQIDQQRKVVDEKKAAVDKLRMTLEQSGVQVGPANDDQAKTDLEEREKDLLAAKEDYDARRVLVEQTKNLSDEELINTLSSLGRSDANITELRAEILKIESQVDDLLKTGFSGKPPDVSSLRSDLDRKHQQLKELVAGTRRAMQIDLEMAKSRVELLQKEVDTLKTTPGQNSDPRLDPYRATQRDMEEQQSILDALTIRLKQVQADRQLMESPVRIISRAEAPRFPTRPNKALDLGLTVVAGIVLGVLVATVMTRGKSGPN